MKLFLEHLIEDWMSVATFTNYLLKEFKICPLSKILDAAILDNSFPGNFQVILVTFWKNL